MEYSMDGNGLPNTGTSLDLDAISNAVGNDQHGFSGGQHSDSDDGEDEHEQLQRNEELRNLLTNAFDDLIDDDESHGENEDEDRDSPDGDDRKEAEAYEGDTLFSPLHGLTLQHAETPTTSDLSSRLHKKHCVRFSPMESTKIHTYQIHSPEDRQKRYLSSGLNSHEELEALYAARGEELDKLSAKCHELEHKVALLEGEKTGISVSLQNTDKVLRDCQNENWALKSEIQKLKEQISSMESEKAALNRKLEGAENNLLALERQILDLNVLDSKRKDENKQEYLLSNIKSRYENELRNVKDELSRIKYELHNKTESYAVLENKFRDLTEMHQRTLIERAETLQEFNRALDQQRLLREQRDTLTTDELSRAREEIERLRMELTNTDSIIQMGLNSNDPNGALRTLRSLLDEKEKENAKLRTELDSVQKENRTVSERANASFREIQSRYRTECEKLEQELAAVKELYLNVCKEKDQIEDQLAQMSHEKDQWDQERQRLLSEISDAHQQNDKNLEEQRKNLDSNWSSRMELAIKESLTRARLEWLKETVQVDEKHEVEKSLGELQCLREAMDAIRGERDTLQSEVHQLKQQMRHERHLLREKFKVEKDELLKKLKEEQDARCKDKKNEELIAATAEAMSRLRQQCEEEKLQIISDYEKQILELQSTITTPVDQCRGDVQNWRAEADRLRMALKTSAPPSLQRSFEVLIRRAELLCQKEQELAHSYKDKYRNLKRKVRDYQLYVNEKVERYKRERQQSEDYFKQAISGLHFKVTKELESLQSRTGVEQSKHSQGSTFTEMVDILQGQINRYVSSMGQFTKNTEQ